MVKTEKNKGGRKSLFKNKVRGARRSLVMTAVGHESIDEQRTRLGAALGLAGPLSLGDYVEGLTHIFGSLLDHEALRKIAGDVNSGKLKATQPK